MVVEALAAEQQAPVDVELVVQPPRVTRSTGPLRVVDGARRVDAYCTALTSNQAHQGRTYGVFPLYGDIGVVDKSANMQRAQCHAAE